MINVRKIVLLFLGKQYILVSVINRNYIIAIRKLIFSFHLIMMMRIVLVHHRRTSQAMAVIHEVVAKVVVEWDGHMMLNNYYKYECEIAHGELRYSLTDDQEDEGDILIVMLSIACIFGIVVGYLLYTKRKKSAEKESSQTILTM